MCKFILFWLDLITDFIILISLFIFLQYIGVSYGASSDSDSSDSYMDQYQEAKKKALDFK